MSIINVLLLFATRKFV